MLNTHTQKEAGRWLGISSRAIRDLETRVPELALARDAGDWQTYCRAAFAHYRGLSAGWCGSEGTNLTRERARLAAAQAEAHEVKNRTRAGELLEAADVTYTWSTKARAIRDQIRALPKLLAVRVPGFTREMATASLEVIDERLNAVADTVAGESKRRKKGAKPR